MRLQVEQRLGASGAVAGGWGPLRMEDIVQAHQQEVELFVPPKPEKKQQNRGTSSNQAKRFRSDTGMDSAWPAKKAEHLPTKGCYQRNREC